MGAFLIAEVGVNHNGDAGLAFQLIDAAAKAGAHAVKFQTFSADTLIVKGTSTVKYQQDSAGESDQYDMLSALELSFDEYAELAKACERAGVEFMSTAFDTKALKFLVDLGIGRIKIPSGEVTNIPFVKAAAAHGLPMLLSTGMATLDEVRQAVCAIREVQAGTTRNGAGAGPVLSVMHCTSAYPAPLAHLNLNALKTMADELDVAIGYSDHSDGILIAPVTVAMGARVIEKHITLDRTMKGPDHAASIEPDAFAQMVKNIADIELSLGDGIKAPRGDEIETAKLVRRGLKAAADLPRGHVLTADDIVILRPQTGIAPRDLEATIGKKLSRALAAGDPIGSADIV